MTVHNCYRAGFAAHWFFVLALALAPSLGLAAPDAASGPALIVATVDLPVILTFHPAMRDFDFRAGRFVSRPKERPLIGGAAAYESAREEREHLLGLKLLLEKQGEIVNQELMERAKGGPAASRGTSPAYAKQVEITREYRQKLAALAGKVLGGFAESNYEDPSEARFRQILEEVWKAIQAAVTAEKAMMVLNLPVVPAAAPPVERAVRLVDDPDEVLQRWNIQSIEDLEALVRQASGSSPMPLGKPTPAPGKGKVCGGHFESVTDPAFLKTLIGEYFAARETFAAPFLNLGAGRRVLSGTNVVVQKDLTKKVLELLFDWHKTRQAERDAVFSVLEERLGLD